MMTLRAVVSFLLALSLTQAFAPQRLECSRRVSPSSPCFSKRSPTLSSSTFDDDQNNTPANNSMERSFFPFKSTAVTALVTTAMLTTMSSPALADSPDWGIFEGRTGSLLHPVMMGSLLLFSIYTGVLGLQWRRQRTIGDEIKDLKNQLPDLQGAKSVQDALQAAKQLEGDEYDGALVATLQAALPTDEMLEKLSSERKELVDAKPRDKHFSNGALLAFLGTAFAIEGPLNTYARAGKLFPGPHLYAGAGLVVLWALAAACVPAMSKGNDTARSVHIAANAVGIGLFGWQVVSGIPILLKVIEKTQWP